MPSSEDGDGEQRPNFVVNILKSNIFCWKLPLLFQWRLSRHSITILYLKRLPFGNREFWRCRHVEEVPNSHKSVQPQTLQLYFGSVSTSAIHNKFLSVPLPVDEVSFQISTGRFLWIFTSLFTLCCRKSLTYLSVPMQRTCHRELQETWNSPR